jgi:integrase
VVVAALRERPVLQEERAAAGASWAQEWATEALVFTTANGHPVDASNLRRYFRRACKLAGIGRWTPYEMRHSAATLMSAAGVPLEHVADVLGHNGTRMAAWSTATSWRPPSRPGPGRCRRCWGSLTG